jgi:hypothetical protein
MRMLLPGSYLPNAQRRFPWIVAGSVGLVGVLLLTALAVGLPTHAVPALPAAAAPSPPVAPPVPSPTDHTSSLAGTGTASPSSEGWYRVPGKGVSPSPRYGASMAFDAKDGYLLFFGGCGKQCPLGDTWKYQGGVWVNLTSQLVAAPPARSGASMVYDARDGYLLLFGGTGTSGALDDSWRFVGGTWSPLAVSGSVPSARSDAAATYDTTDGSVLIFGGLSASGTPLGDTWSYANGLWSDLSASLSVSPPARSGAGFVSDSTDGFSLLFGGTGACGSPCGDTWTYVADHWTNRTGTTGTAPSARTDPTMSDDPGRGLVVLYGGANTTVLGDTWTFVHGSWTDISGNLSATPAAREAGSAAYDATDGYLFLFGGSDGSTLRPWSWALLSPLSATLRPTTASVAPGVGDVFSATVTGGLAPYNLSWGFGDGSPASVGPTVGHTFQLPGTYSVSVSVTDSLATTIAAVVNVSVLAPSLAVGISATPTSPRAGESITVSANASGGLPPYSFIWAGAVTGCTWVSSSAVTCVEPVTGTQDFAVTVTDAAGHTASASTNVTVLNAAGSLVNAPSLSNHIGPAGWSTSLTAAVLALGMTIACAGAVITYRAGRRREAERSASRPLCYAVPAWSETPAEFPPPEESPVGPWDRP